MLKKAAKLRSERAELAKELSKNLGQLEEHLTEEEKGHLRSAVIGENEGKLDPHAESQLDVQRSQRQFTERQGRKAFNEAMHFSNQREETARQKEIKTDQRLYRAMRAPPKLSQLPGKDEAEERRMAKLSELPSAEEEDAQSEDELPEAEPITEEEFWQNVEAFW